MNESIFPQRRNTALLNTGDAVFGGVFQSNPIAFGWTTPSYPTAITAGSPDLVSYFWVPDWVREIQRLNLIFWTSSYTPLDGIQIDGIDRSAQLGITSIDTSVVLDIKPFITDRLGSPSLGLHSVAVLFDAAATANVHLLYDWFISSKGHL